MVHTKLYKLELKWWDSYQLPEQLWEHLKKDLLKGTSQFIELWNMVVNRFEIKRLSLIEATNELEAYIMWQPKAMRDKIETYAKSSWITWKSIDHVSNFIQDNTDA